MMKKIIFLLTSTFFHCFVFAQTENTSITKNENEKIIGKIIITEKSDYSVYKNNKYLGLTSRESKIYLNEKVSGNFFEYKGEAFILQKTKHNQKQIASPIDKILEIRFSLDLDEIQNAQNKKTAEINPYQPQKFLKDPGYPLFRNFPLLPDKEFSQQDVGSKWEGKSTVVVKPTPQSQSTRIPVYVEFEYRGLTEYNKKIVHHIKAQFGLRYRSTDKYGDKNLNHSQGGRKVDIYLDLTNRPIFIREKIEEEFFYNDGSRIKHRGFLLHFYSYRNFSSSNFLGQPLINNLQKNIQDNTSKMPSSSHTSSDIYIAKIKPTKNFDVTKTKRGTVLNLKTLNFVADQAILLDGETEKLKEIADILRNIENGFFLVEGHTADIGKPKEQKQLSIQRAKSIANELIKLGIPSDKIIYSGLGGTKPIATNETPEGKSKNRRVEITIF